MRRALHADDRFHPDPECAFRIEFIIIIIIHAREELLTVVIKSLLPAIFNGRLLQIYQLGKSRYNSPINSGLIKKIVA